jgi:hypothetical protein
MGLGKWGGSDTYAGFLVLELAVQVVCVEAHDLIQSCGLVSVQF